jgi:hypothetical protein
LIKKRPQKPLHGGSIIPEIILAHLNRLCLISPMRNCIACLLGLTLSVTSPLEAAPAPPVAATVDLLAPITDTPVTSVRVGQQFRVRITAKGLDLTANKSTTVTYTLSVLPRNSKVPITISGRVSAQLTLPESEGGAGQTTARMAGIAGQQETTYLLTVPNYVPEGIATLTLTFRSKDAGRFSVNRKVEVRL